MVYCKAIARKVLCCPFITEEGGFIYIQYHIVFVSYLSTSVPARRTPIGRGVDIRPPRAEPRATDITSVARGICARTCDMRDSPHVWQASAHVVHARFER